MKTARIIAVLLLIGTAANYAKAGKFREAVLSAQKALNLARNAGEEQLAQQIQSFSQETISQL